MIQFNPGPTKQGELGEWSLPQYLSIQNYAPFQVHTRTYQRYQMAIRAFTNYIQFYCFTVCWTGKSNIQFLPQKLDCFGITTIFLGFKQTLFGQFDAYVSILCPNFQNLAPPRKCCVGGHLLTLSERSFFCTMQFLLFSST